MPRLIAVEKEGQKMGKKRAAKTKRDGERKMACQLEKVSFAIEIKRMSLQEVISAHLKVKKKKRESESHKIVAFLTIIN